MQRVAIIENNIVINVVVCEAIEDLPKTDNNYVYIVNDWVGPGDWWEETEARFYRAIPNNDDVAQDEQP